MVDGMDEPLFMPRRNIRVDGNEAPEDIDNLRPNSRRPFEVDQDSVVIILWFMPAIPIESFRMVTFDNVESITVWFVTTTGRRTRRVLAVEVCCLLSSYYLRPT
jgi:hypothetical protein